MNFTLYGTDGCHLCDDAAALIVAVSTGLPLNVFQEDIAESEALVEQYGTRIPVLRHDGSGEELDWPFDAGQLRRFLTQTLTQ